MTKSIERLLIVVAAITLVLPFDFIPDTFPVIGWLDDLTAIIFLIKEFVSFIRKRKSVITPIPPIRK
jgi:uncharacterized membrane protein YkvA (DUF1232 family)